MCGISRRADHELIVAYDRVWRNAHVVRKDAPLVGHNLAKLQANGVVLLEGLHRHRVPWIVEGDELRTAKAAGDSVAVTSILITSTR